MPDPPENKLDGQPLSIEFTKQKNYIVDNSGAMRLIANLLVTLQHHIWWRLLVDLDSRVDLSLSRYTIRVGSHHAHHDQVGIIQGTSDQKKKTQIRHIEVGRS